MQSTKIPWQLRPHLRRQMNLVAERLATVTPAVRSKLASSAVAASNGWRTFRRAMLLEALGSSMTQLSLPPERAIRLLCRALRDAWQVPRPAVMTGAPRPVTACVASSAGRNRTI